MKRSRFSIVALALFCAGLCAASAAGQPKPLSSYDAQVKELLAKMTLDEKVGQMTQPDLGGLKDPNDVAKYFVGSVLSGAAPTQGGQQPRSLDEHVRPAAEARPPDPPGIPILYGVDAVHGTATS